MSPFLLMLALVSPAPDHAHKALELQQAGKYKAAIEEYRAAVKEHPKEPGLLTNLGTALAHEGDFGDAVLFYQQALRLDSTFAEARVNLGLAYYKLLRWTDAAREFGAYRSAHPRDLRSGLLFADSCLQLDRYREAIDTLEPLEKVYPENLGIAYVLGTAYIRNRQENLGSPLIERIMQQGDVPEVHMMMGDSYRLAHEYKKSVDEYRRALAMAPNLPLAHLRAGETTLAMGDLAGAVQDFEAEYRVNPNNFDLNFYLGYVHKQNGTPEKAKFFLERAAILRPDTYQPNFQLALLANDRGDVTEARQRLERAVREHPDASDAHAVLAQIYYRLRLKDAGRREQEVVARLTAQQQANEQAQRKGEGTPSAEPVPQP